MRDRLFYVQDARTYVGNDMLWWAKGNAGYTTDLGKAEIYTEAEISRFIIADHRDTDVVWPFDYINGLARRAVDMQYAKKEHIVKELEIKA